MTRRVRLDFPTHRTGAANEYAAAAWYLKCGHLVYWPAVQHGAVDFIAEVGRRCLRVQVKTATWTRSGDGRYLQCRVRLSNRRIRLKPADLYDVLFIVAPDGRMWNIPSRLVDCDTLSLDATGPRAVSRWAKYLASPLFSDKPKHRGKKYEHSKVGRGAAVRAKRGANRRRC